MPFRILEWDDTPNPLAKKATLDRRISDGPVSVRRPDDAASHPLAAALFEAADLTSLLLLHDWVSVNKAPKARWPAVKKAVAKVLADWPEDPATGAGAEGVE